MSKTMRTPVAIGLMIALLITMSGCTVSEDLTKTATSKPVAGVSDLNADSVKLTDLGVRLFQAMNTEEENTLISPISILYALAMTMNGAKGETLEQMQSVLGMPPEEMNPYLYSYMRSLPQSEKAKLTLANSIWIADNRNIHVNGEFLQCNADYYGADIYKTPFNNATLSDINGWVKENTDGMIPEILQEISPDTVMYLINALAFDAQWKVVYEEHQVRPGTFTNEDGSETEAEFMYSSEHAYIRDEKASGFVKYYCGSDYAFVALLPDEGVTVSEYVDSLTGERLQVLLADPEYAEVNAGLPKFETEYTIELSETLRNMGMPNAFDSRCADFSGIDNSLYISMVLHKTYISVAEQGTRAGAATIVGMDNGCIIQPDPIEINLNRPFVYLLIDCETNIPFFMGTMMTPGG